METRALAFRRFEEIKAQHPDEWVLVAEPQYEGDELVGGIVLFHSKDKKEVCYIGRDKTKAFNNIAIEFTGKPKAARKIGIMKRL